MPDRLGDAALLLAILGAAALLVGGIGYFLGWWDAD